MLKLVLPAALCVALAGCAYNAVPKVSPSFNVYSNFGTKVSGHYLLFVDTTGLDQTIRATGLTCSAHHFPVDIAASFADSIAQTLGNVVESVELVTAPVPGNQLAAHNARGMIVIRGENTEGRLIFAQNLFGTTATASINSVATITVDNRGGRLLGMTVEGHGEGDAPGGFLCDGGADALASAAADAVTDISRSLGEAIANSDRVRNGG